MTITSAAPALAAAAARAAPAIIDCDIHNIVPTDAALGEFLPERWRHHLANYSIRFAYTGAFDPRLNPNVARSDAWPPSGLIPGSDLGFSREEPLDAWNIEYGILNPLYLAGEQANQEYGAALAIALNAWLVAAWLDPEPRLRSSMVVPYEDGDLAAGVLAPWGILPSPAISAVLRSLNTVIVAINAQLLYRQPLTT